MVKPKNQNAQRLWTYDQKWSCHCGQQLFSPHPRCRKAPWMYFSPTPASRVKHLVGSSAWSYCTLLPFHRVSLHRPGSQASKTLYSVLNLSPTEHKQGSQVLEAANGSRSLLNKGPCTGNPLKSTRCAPLLPVLHSRKQIQRATSPSLQPVWSCCMK